MKKRILGFKSASILATILTGYGALAGGMEGGGGKSIVCRDTTGAIKSAEVLDLYEGRVQYGLTYTESALSSDQQATAIFSSSGLGTDQSFPPSTVYDYYMNARSHLKFVPLGTDLNPINDSFEVIAPKNCAIEQTVNYQNDQLVLVSKEIWDALSETQRAALMIHESSYRYLRNYHETNSRRARHFTAYLFLGGRVEDTYPGNDYAALCETTDRTKPLSSFYVSKVFVDSNGSNKVRLNFSSFGGRKLYSKSFVEINSDVGGGKSFLDLLKNPSSSYQIVEQSLTTTSLFEGGDVFTLRIGAQVGEKQISLSGTSATDGTALENEELSCFFRADP